MKSRIRKNIVENEKIVHNSKIEAKKLYEIAKSMEISVQKLGNMFQLKEMAKSKVRSQKGKVKVKLYTLYEWQEIQQQIQKEYQDIPEINYQIIKSVKNKYKIGDNEIKNLFQINYRQFQRLKNDKEYQVKNTISEKIEKKEIIEKYRYKSYINKEDIQNMKKEYYRFTIDMSHLK